MKRIAAITEIESSNSWSTGKTDLAYHASLAGLNMMGKFLFNHLRPEGFTFRWYCDDGAPGGMCAADYITSGLCYDERSRISIPMRTGSSCGTPGCVRSRGERGAERNHIKEGRLAQRMRRRPFLCFPYNLERFTNRVQVRLFYFML